jgi:hypothetical protein
MAVCEVCGNDYDKSFEVISSSSTRVLPLFHGRLN